MQMEDSEMFSDSSSDDIDLPPILKVPELKRVNVAEDCSWQGVILTVATTGIEIYKDEICQLELVYKQRKGGYFNWCRHILPNKPIKTKATEYNGFSSGFTSAGKKVLYWKAGRDSSKQIVCTLPVKVVIKNFQRKLRQLSAYKRIFLIVYNASYDVPILFRTMKECGISPLFLRKLNICFVDMQSQVKAAVKRGQLPQGIDNLKQRTVYNYLHNDPNDKKHVHDAHKDAETLLAITTAPVFSRVPLETYLKSSSTTKSQYNLFRFKRQTYKRLQTMHGKLFYRGKGRKGVIGEDTARKLAKSGLEYKHIKNLWKRANQLEFEKQMKQRRIRKDTSSKLIKYFRHS